MQMAIMYVETFRQKRTRASRLHTYRYDRSKLIGLIGICTHVLFCSIQPNPHSFFSQFLFYSSTTNLHNEVRIMREMKPSSRHGAFLALLAPNAVIAWNFCSVWACVSKPHTVFSFATHTCDLSLMVLLLIRKWNKWNGKTSLLFGESVSLHQTKTAASTHAHRTQDQFPSYRVLTYALSYAINSTQYP